MAMWEGAGVAAMAREVVARAVVEAEAKASCASADCGNADCDGADCDGGCCQRVGEMGCGCGVQRAWSSHPAR